MSHGKRSTYNLGCRCNLCKKANTDYQISWQKLNYISRKHAVRTYNPRPVEYQAWANAKQRTTNPNNPLWKYYGGRGITMCQAWMNSFEEFLTYVGPRPEGLTLDRIDNSKGYEPGNVRWATQKTQCQNRRKIDRNLKT